MASNETVRVEQCDQEAAQTAWNAGADEFNQWHALSLAEQDRWAYAFARHRLSQADGQREARPFNEWHEDHGDVLWWHFPIVESPYVGSPLDLGRAMKVVVQIGFEEHDLPITNTGGWPFSEDDEARLFWTPLPAAPTLTEVHQEKNDGR